MCLTGKVILEIFQEGHLKIKMFETKGFRRGVFY